MQWDPGYPLQNGKYTITKVLGEGGFGITYLADSQEYGQVVIKTLHGTAQQRPDFDQFQNDFMNEALKIRGCQHPHIVKVHKLFQEKLPRPNRGNAQASPIYLVCMVMEFIEGRDLANRGQLREPEALHYIAQVGTALAVVHENGLLHRDVKPSNIMVRQGTNEAVLIDFGIAREFTPNVTRTHTQFLTEGYAPIEQYELQTKRGPFTDVYALAATLYCLLTGQIPVGSQTRMIQSLQQQRDGLEPPQVMNPAVSDRVNMAIMKGIALRPEYRPQTMGEWLELLGVGSQPWPRVGALPIAHSNPVLPPRSSVALAPTMAPTMAPHRYSMPTSASSLSRRSWLKWAGLGGVGVMLALLLRPWEPNKPEPRPLMFWERIIPDQDVVDVNSEGTIVRSYPVTVDTYVEDLGNGVQFRMVRIPEGRFEMGSPPDEASRAGDEGPQHVVDVPTFYVGMVTVTQAVYEVVMGDNPSRFQEGDRPVEQVTWHDAIAFCQKLSDRTVNTYRLPSEAEWEYACRAGTTTPFHFGETITTAIANYNGGYTYRNAPTGDYRQETTLVGSFPPNAFGLFDMHGNVWEWCADHWHDNYNGAPTDGSAWVTGGDSESRVLQGGSWLNRPRDCRSANRFRHLADAGNLSIGFRLVCSSPRTV
ncbi:MAG: SUMF1/EgtB/PvdO family nonheme iron enzyme [Leptolyngbyaceae cyanobacterium]